MTRPLPDVEAMLLRRRRMVLVEPTGGKGTEGGRVPDKLLQAVELELAKLWFVPSTRLRDALSRLSVDGLCDLQVWLLESLAREKGDDYTHTPLFRKFPEDIPEDTQALWVQKVLSHFFQGEGQSCLFCGASGTTHVLRPCQHVVCEVCFDGANYSACPVCEHKVDTTSPFFKASEFRAVPQEGVRLVRLDLCEDFDADLQALFLDFCARTQPMNPTDVEDLRTLVAGYGEHVLPWLPDSIPVKENAAHILGALLRSGDPERVLPHVAKLTKTATDVLRIIVSYSDADPALQGSQIFHALNSSIQAERFWGTPGEWARAAAAGDPVPARHLTLKVSRFKVGKISRPLRRTFLGLLEAMNEAALTEDMLRHRSYWVWVGEFLHPYEYRRRFPKVARAFAVVRGKDADGTPAPAFQTYYGKVEAAAAAGDAAKMTELLSQRPGELARRFDHLLRVAGTDLEAVETAVAAFEKHTPRFSTPVLLTLHGLLPKRDKPAPVRIFWPKGSVSKGVSAKDNRPPLRADVIRPATRVVEAELLRRFGAQPSLEDCVIDEGLRNIVAPFNERTASPSAVNLPRGSVLAVPEGKTMRLFLHWCEPEDDESSTDLDLSVGFYDSDWAHVGVCSYYQLQCGGFSKSAGDLRSAPFPDGASEFVDVDVEAARAAGVRFAVMVVNAYSGLPFDRLERAFAGLMLRDDVGGKHFDPRTVQLRFDLQGEHGVFMPLVVDLESREMHWLDTYAKGEFAFNNVESSNNAIQTVCPNLMTYFGSRVRLSMFELVCLHAAARGKRVFLRSGGEYVSVERGTSSPSEFLDQLRGGEGTRVSDLPQVTQPALGALLNGDVSLQTDGGLYTLFPGLVTGNLAAASFAAVSPTEKDSPPEVSPG